jgi:hypothetical protein
MMKMRIAAALAVVLIGTAALPTVTAFAQGNDPEQTTAAETTAAVETTVPAAESTAETSAVTETAETDANDGTDAEHKETESEAAGDEEKKETFDLSFLDLSGIPGVNLDVYADILSDLDPEVAEVLLKNPKLLAYFLPTLHVTVTDNAVTVAVDGDEPEEDPVRTGHVRTNGSNLNVRTGPGIGFDIINSLANGTEVQVMKEENGWYQLEFPAKYSYVCGKYLELNDITPKETPEGYTFDIDGEMMAGLLSAFSRILEEDPQPVPEIHGLTPDGNLSLVDDIGPITGEGQQFVTLVTKAGNYFYLIIDRNEKGEENVHFLNLVDERDLFTLMEEDDQNIYTEQLAAEQAAKEAAEKAAQEAAQKESEADQDADKDKESGKSRSMLPLLLIPLVIAAAGGGWFYVQTKKKKQAVNTPDPDADYTDDDDDEDYGAGEDDADGDDNVVVVSDTGSDPYEDEILADDRDDPEEV